MFTFEKSVFIDRPVEDVFAFASDPANDTQWQDLELSEMTSDGPVGPGSTFRSVSKFMGREMDITAELIVYDPPNQFSFQTTSGPIQFTAHQTFQSQSSGTLMTLSGEVEVGGFFKVAEGMVAKQAESRMESDLANLKALLEG
jgi:uncharacterized protein YndB with AHSA1/START domain